MAGNTQAINSWRRCGQCQGLWFSADPGSSKCPAGGSHTIADLNTNYSVLSVAVVGPPAGGEDQWHQCVKCQGLFYSGGGVTGGVCPRDNQAHQANLADDWWLQFYGAQGWNRCANCMALFPGSAAGSSVCPAQSGGHVADGVHTYTMPTGAFLEQLNVIVRSKPGDSVIALTSSPDGKLGNLINGTSPIFGGVVPWDQTGGAVAVAPAFSTTKSCVAYACYANDGTANLNIGWVSCTNNGPTQPVSVAGPIVGYPALCYVGDTLWVAYGSSDNLAPQIQQVTIADSGAVTLGTRRVAGNATMGLRISACQQNGTLYLAHANYDDHGNPLYNLCVSMPLSASTSQSYTMYAGLQSSPAIVAVRDDRLPIVAYVDSNDNTLKYVTFNGNAPYPESPFSSPVAVPGQASGDFDATSNPSLAVQLGQTAAGDVIYLAYRQANSGCLMLRTYTGDLLTALDSRVLSGVPIDAPPTVFLALPGGVPLYP